ncbi:MAG TPA: hypothetical protein H9985_01915 [Candidatus Anaerofilum faecale]|nr:hypothetical protein [Candidatus Anaerofilum faecale]
MKRDRIWYVGYLAAAVLALVGYFGGLNEPVRTGVCVLAAVVFAVSYVQLLHGKMMKTDRDYRISVLDERSIAIKEKAGNIANMVNTVLMGLAAVLFILLDQLLPAVVMGVCILVQPVILIVISDLLDKKM